MVDREHGQACLVRGLGRHGTVCPSFFFLVLFLSASSICPSYGFRIFYLLVFLPSVLTWVDLRMALSIQTFLSIWFACLSPFYFLWRRAHLRFLRAACFFTPPPLRTYYQSLHPTFVFLFTCCRRWRATATAAASRAMLRACNQRKKKYVIECAIVVVATDR
jgi:hypothetical protein